MSAREIVIFDLGGVLIDWDPRHLYRKLFGGDDAAMERFLAEVCSRDWNRALDAGALFADAAGPLKQRHPHQADLIDAYLARFGEMMPGPIAGTVDILHDLHARGTPLYALTNFSPETFPHALRLFDFLNLFRGIVVSGAEKLVKPDLPIYRLLIERFDIAPERAVFVDDAIANVEAARRLGMHGIHFHDPAALHSELVTLELL